MLRLCLMCMLKMLSTKKDFQFCIVLINFDDYL